MNIMKELRDPSQGCPWDRAQTFQTIAPYTIEEAYEVSDAIQREDMSELQDELGDLLFQVVFHAQLAAEQGCFDFNDVVNSIVDKMHRRHPHVFGDEKIEDAEAQTHAWEKHKHVERQQKKQTATQLSLLDGIPLGLPALTRAVKLQRRAARVGFDWTSIAPILEKIIEELEEVKQEIEQQADHQLVEDEIGDLFFAVSNLARHLAIDPETSIRRSNAKFERRFKAVETLALQQDKLLEKMTIDEMEVLYQQVKQSEK
ncbi:nucleoside triphosphate pyrophosphohydrolase [Kaarinaea lacus]